MMEKIVVAKGDCHGSEQDIVWMIESLSDRGVRPSDVVVIVAGDFGIPWPGDPDDDAEKLDVLNDLGCQIVAVLGNHEWWSLVKSMPHGIFCNANVHQCVFMGKLYDNIHYVADPAVMTIDGRDYLLIPGADSHDIRDGVLRGLDPLAEGERMDDWYQRNKGEITEFNESFRQKNGYWPQYRIDGVTWWPDEAIRFDELEALLSEQTEFHAVVSHDAPDTFAYEFQLRKSLYDRYPPTEAERKLDKVYKSIGFKHWMHGHFHEDARSVEDPRVMISYYRPHILSDNFHLTRDEEYDMIYPESNYFYR